MAKKLFVKTYGCQMNVYDSARMADVLAPLGYAPAEGPDGADMVILNTCHIREKAAEKVFSELGRLRPLQAARQSAGQDMLIAVAGCVAQAEGEEILRRAPFVDMVFGPQTYHRLPEMVARATRAGARSGQYSGTRAGHGVLETEFPPEPKFDFLPETMAAPGSAAFLAVQEGCDKFCSFCVVPYTRGAEYSRPGQAILEEARRLVDLGAVEITLLGQNVNAYHGEGPQGGAWTLGRLIEALARIPGVKRLRYTTSHPLEMDETLIAAHRDVPELMPFLHLPVQSGADRILEAMNRRHRAEDYRRIVERLRRARPDIALSSDFIVGFPGESEADFVKTLDLVREVEFAQAYSFKFSPRPGTPAAAMPETMQLAEEVKAERLARLQALLAAQQLAFNRATIGRRLEVLFEREGRKPGQIVGRSPYMQAVHLEAVPAAGAALGRLAEVEIVEAFAVSLAARLAPVSPHPLSSAVPAAPSHVL